MADSQDETTESPVESPPTTGGAASPDDVLMTSNGKDHTRAQLEALLDRGAGLREADYTRKTQDLADDRRAWESQRDTEQEDIDAQRLATLDNGYEEDPRYDKLASKFDDLQKTIVGDREERKAQDAHDKGVQEWDAAMEFYRKEPFADMNEIVNYMTANQLGPSQMKIAYDALYGGVIAKKLYEAEVDTARAGGPPPMGAGPTTISPGFTQPADAPGARAPRPRTMQEARDAALKDPNAPQV